METLSYCQLMQRCGELEAQVKRLVAERDAVVAKEQEPVAYIIQDAEMRSRGNPGFLSYDGSISNEDINEYEISITPLYTHPVTDSMRASMRAEGVDIVRNSLIAFVEDEVDPNENVPGLIRGAEVCVSIAAQLRSQSEQVKGVQDE